MLIDELRKRRTEALKARDMLTKEVLNVAIGEIDTLAARHKRDATDEDCLGVIRKLVKANEETRAMSTDDTQRATLTREIEVLNALLPAQLGVADVVAMLAPVRDALRAAGNDGQATGIAMKHLKASGAAVDGKVVSQAVRDVRA
mgnify:CR=1 FL=1